MSIWSVFQSVSYEQQQQQQQKQQQPQQQLQQQQQQQQQNTAGGSTAKNSVPKKTAPWMNSIQDSSEFKYQYQVPSRGLNDVLEADRHKLALLQQPVMLNNQLDQFYSELEMEERTDVELDEDTSSSSSCNGHFAKKELRRRSNEFRRTMLYEENAPFPRPDYKTSGQHS